MALDIIPGDFLVVATVEYPIRAVWGYSDHDFGDSAMFTDWATVSCKTTRSPAVASGKRGLPANNLTSIKCTPLDPANPETIFQLQMQTPNTKLETFISDGTDYSRLIIEDIRA